MPAPAEAGEHETLGVFSPLKCSNEYFSPLSGNIMEWGLHVIFVSDRVFSSLRKEKSLGVQFQLEMRSQGHFFFSPPDFFHSVL